MKILKILFLVLLLSTAVVIAIDDDEEEGLDCDVLDIDTDLDNPISGKISSLYMYRSTIDIPDAHGLPILQST